MMTIVSPSTTSSENPLRTRFVPKSLYTSIRRIIEGGGGGCDDARGRRQDEPIDPRISAGGKNGRVESRHQDAPTHRRKRRRQWRRRFMIRSIDPRVTPRSCRARV